MFRLCISNHHRHDLHTYTNEGEFLFDTEVGNKSGQIGVYKQTFKVTSTSWPTNLRLIITKCDANT